MSAEHGRKSRLYWGTWGGLLALTVLMLIVDSSPIPRLAFLTVLVGAMATKAALIGANFMHLRFERAALALTVVIGLIVTGVVLFALIAPDALRIAAMRRG